MSAAKKLKVNYKREVSINQDYLEYLKGMAQYVAGKKMPAAVRLEQAVLGGCLIDVNAFGIIRMLLEPKHFYEERHQIIFRALQEMDAENARIDLLTVSEYLTRKKEELKIGGAYYLVELTSVVASTANIEYHARIIYQKWIARDGVRLCATYLKKFLNEEDDVFDQRNSISDHMRVMPPQGFFRVEDFNTAIQKGADAPELTKMCGHLWNRTEVAFFFGPPGTGKSIAAVMIADALSKGKDVLPGILVNECPPQKVLYIDFELTNRNIKTRYSNEAGEEYEFDEDMLKRAYINDNFLDYDKPIDKIAQQQIEQMILLHKPEVMIVDNITYLTSESNQDADIAKRLMKRLVYYKKKYHMSLLVIAHTTKSTLTSFQPLEQRDMAGSAQLQNFADAIFGIKTSALDPNMKYLKQFKDRNEPEENKADNVIVMQTEMGGKERNFLTFNYMRHDKELTHLSTPDDEQAMKILIEQACQIQAKEYTSFGRLIKEIGWTKSRNNLISKMRAYATESWEYEVGESGKIVYAVPIDEVPLVQSNNEMPRNHNNELAF